jgi:ABC-type Zn uptake system ZnuABC Zn-binding protein ZnuA
MTPFTIVTNNIKYLGVTLTKQLKDLYDKNFKSLKKEIKDLRRWKDGHLAKSNLQIQCIPYQNPNSNSSGITKNPG